VTAATHQLSSTNRTPCARHAGVLGRGNGENSGVLGGETETTVVYQHVSAYFWISSYLEMPDLETPPQGDPSKAVPLRRLGFIFVDVTMTAYSTLPSSSLLSREHGC